MGRGAQKEEEKLVPSSTATRTKPVSTDSIAAEPKEVLDARLMELNRIAGFEAKLSGRQLTIRFTADPMHSVNGAENLVIRFRKQYRNSAPDEGLLGSRSWPRLDERSANLEAHSAEWHFELIGR